MPGDISRPVMAREQFVKGIIPILLCRSENDPVNGLSPKQLFTVYAMCDCGRDLEAYQLAGYVQARSLLLQVRLEGYVGGMLWDDTRLALDWDMAGYVSFAMLPRFLLWGV